MQENVLGTRRTAVMEMFVTCTHCGYTTSLRYARVMQSNVFLERNSTYEHMCRE
jgi:hypothetical protein